MSGRSINFKIVHEIKGRMRISLFEKRLTGKQADTLQYYLLSKRGILIAKIYERTADAAIEYRPDVVSRADVLTWLRCFSFQDEKNLELVPEHTGRELNKQYKEKLVGHILIRCATRLFLPAPLRRVKAVWNAVRFIKMGIQCLAKGRLEVPVLDATAIGVSLLRGDYDTASSVMFLLKTGELLEEWTHKKSVDDLARSMCLNVDQVWMILDGKRIATAASAVCEGDILCVQAGNMIPMDGIVVDGEAMVNQASLTGEAIPVKRSAGSYVYAGTVLEEGELSFCVKKAAGATRYEKIIQMIEESEKMKSSVESRAEHLADRLVPFSFLGTGLAYLLTRNITKAISILMVDFSCALKLAMPLSVLSAMRECSQYQVTVKGGKFLEAAAAAKTLVFDKTGTLTKSQPSVREVIPFGGRDRNEMLRLAACLEEHFPHSMANAVVMQAKKEHLRHEELHSKVEYIVAHGISSYVAEEKVVIGSYHFVFEDEGVRIPEGEEEAFAGLSPEYSYLYMAISGVLAAVIGIEDPLRPEAASVIRALKESGFEKIVMMTGDSEKTARAVAEKVGVDEYYSEVLPEDKASFIKKEKQAGRIVMMVGDGINDSPALSEADVGISIREGAQIARTISDITIAGDDLVQLVTLKRLGCALMKRIHGNYRFVMSFNTLLILLGLAGVLPLSTSAFLHNGSTLALGMKSMTPLLPKEEHAAME